ncbi:MAG: RtcB family protein, partial [Candidatus Ryanbacteria bacterium]|nr:RtcB family protein [Candidatus Ryanbacteria bacterium]
MHDNTFSEKIRLLGCSADDPRTAHILNEIAEIKSLASPAVCLPDLHLKDRTEAPSSFAAATECTIVPELTAPSVGCGMGIVVTELNAKDIDYKFFEAFYREMQKHRGPRYGHFKNLLLWLGLIARPKNKYDLSVEQFEGVVRRGAKAASEIYCLPAETLWHVEYAGSMFSEEEARELNFKSILPRVSYRSGRHDLGYGFRGNHFLEIQYVEEMLDIKTAREWGLREGSVVIMYHGGG